MSDMIDGLHQAALEAGQDASRNLASAEARAVMDEQVRHGRRRRRTFAGAIAAGAFVVVAAAAVIVPRLGLDAPIVEPAEVPRSVISSVGNLTVFDDGSMSLYTQRGTFVDLVPSEGIANAEFGPISHQIACAFDPTAMEPGWKFHVDAARQVLLFARPQMVSAEGERTTLSQGSNLGTFSAYKVPYLAFTMDAEVATAPQIAIRETAYSVYAGEPVDSNSAVKSFATILDVNPKVTISGDADAWNRVAAIEARVVEGTQSCDDAFVAGALAAGEPFPVRTYLLADIFLLDREGHAMLLATHTSWTEAELIP